MASLNKKLYFANLELRISFSTVKLWVVFPVM